MTTYTSHGTYCDTCNQLAHATRQEAATTGKARHKIATRGDKLHVAATINNGNNNRVIGDETNRKDYPL